MKHIERLIPTIAATTLVSVVSVSLPSRAAIIPFGDGDVFTGNGFGFALTQENENDLEVFSTSCDNAQVSTFPFTNAANNISEICAAIDGGFGDFQVSPLDAEITGGYEPYKGLVGKFFAFGPTLGTVPDEKVFEVVNGNEILTIDVDTSTLVIVGGVNDSVTFSYKTLSTSTDGNDTTTANGVLTFTTQSVDFLDNESIDGGIYDRVSIITSFSLNNNVATPEPGVGVGLAIVSLIGFLGKAKRNQNR